MQFTEGSSHVIGENNALVINHSFDFVGYDGEWNPINQLCRFIVSTGWFLLCISGKHSDLSPVS
jgi:hypothetical protein